MPTEKIRLDALLVQRGCCADSDAATRAILAGDVTSPRLSGLKPGLLVSPDEELLIKADKPFASRGGQKLAAALAGFGIVVEGLDCLDVGAGSGGFTDCLLQRGAARVTAVDVGYGQFDWRLRQDRRVRLVERMNIRHWQPEEGLRSFDLVVVDLSFIRTSGLLGLLRGFLRPNGQLVVLVKPQFELAGGARGGGRAASGANDAGAASGAGGVAAGPPAPATSAGPPGFERGVVKDPALHKLVLDDFLRAAEQVGLVPRGLMSSPLKGADGNTEFLFWATLTGQPVVIDTAGFLEAAL